METEAMMCVLRDWNRLGPDCIRRAKAIYFEFGFALLRAVETVFSNPRCMTASEFFPTFIKVEGEAETVRFGYGWQELTTVSMRGLEQYESGPELHRCRRTPYSAEVEIWLYLYHLPKIDDGRYKLRLTRDEAVRAAEAFRYIGEPPPPDEFQWVADQFRKNLELVKRIDLYG